MDYFEILNIAKHITRDRKDAEKMRELREILRRLKIEMVTTYDSNKDAYTLKIQKGDGDILFTTEGPANHRDK